MILTLIPGNNKARVRAEKLVQRVYRPKKKWERETIVSTERIERTSSKKTEKEN